LLLQLFIWQNSTINSILRNIIKNLTLEAKEHFNFHLEFFAGFTTTQINKRLFATKGVTFCSSADQLKPQVIPAVIEITSVFTGRGIYSAVRHKI